MPILETEPALTDRLLTVDDVIRRWFTLESGKATVTRRWVLKHVPKLQLSPRVIRYRADDVEFFLASRARAA